MSPRKDRLQQLYVLAGERSIRALLAQENDERKEQAIYYLSRTLIEIEMKYSLIKKLFLSLYHAAMKIRHYLLSNNAILISKIDLI